MILAYRISSAGSLSLFVAHRMGSLTASPGVQREALKHLEMREAQDMPLLSYLSNVLREDCNCLFLAETPGQN